MDPSKDQSAINLPLERLVARALSELENHAKARARVRTVLQGSPSSSADDPVQPDARDLNIRRFPALEGHLDTRSVAAGRSQCVR